MTPCSHPVLGTDHLILLGMGLGLSCAPVFFYYSMFPLCVRYTKFILKIICGISKTALSGR